MTNRLLGYFYLSEKEEAQPCTRHFSASHAAHITCCWNFGTISMPIQTVLTKERERRRRFGTEQRYSSKSVSCSGLDYASSHVETELSDIPSLITRTTDRLLR